VAKCISVGLVGGEGFSIDARAYLKIV
jgi:hypothetical protein